MATITEIASHLDELLKTAEIPDYSNALNGIQVETDAEITKVAAAVDARERTITSAIEAGANLLIVHHGMFWGGLQPLRGPNLRRIRSLISSDLALYSSHLPLDAHPELGNNVLLARELGLEPSSGFARYKTIDIGVAGESDLPTAQIIERADALARLHGGSARHTTDRDSRVTRRWAICTGAGASRDTLNEAAARGIDTLIVGEGPHWTAVDAEELGITVIYAGHYATETLGVRALADYVSRRYDIPWTFIEAPTTL
ncbi:MAG TPA: Nif3-like dinuclear metal center hexameric protein [Gemmatimonadaceae bacterium]|jgi:dinuclear metal center YbgI/SA1388 family protein|nr:Nif3-like dinuclear metal center hexameric protein [Gemmatimonadaceae bacterium]